jgi:hypothetical protein
MMTLKELSQLYYLNREIEMDQERLMDLRAKAESATAAPLSDMPKNPTVESKLERYVAEIVDLTAIIEAKQLQCIHERNRLERYICDIDDSLIRQIFTLRFINGLPWLQVALHIGGLTEGYVRNACYGYLKTASEKKMQKMQRNVL